MIPLFYGNASMALAQVRCVGVANAPKRQHGVNERFVLAQYLCTAWRI